jgi:Domain of unknown function (DUF6968)
MKKPDKLGTVIAKRELLFGNGEKVVVRIGKPQLLEGEAFYICPYRIFGLGSSNLRFAPGGLDSVHALQLAFQKIGIELRVLVEAHGGTLWWEGGADGDIGFPLWEEIARELNK